MRKKTNPELAEAIFLAKKHNLKDIGSAISVSSKMQAKVNLEKINHAKEDSVIIPGKVLGGGEIEKGKKIKIYALGFSESAEDKLKKAGVYYEKILHALRENNKLNGKILR